MAERTARALSDCAQTGEDDLGWDVSVSRGFGEGKADLRAWTAHAWEASDALLFVGAAGIAVRAIAPHVASKTNDPAVVAIDEAGRFAVPLLSGHLGGANELAQTVARAVGAIPVITTATDVRGVWAVDTWARCAGLAVSNPEAIKRVSARLLSGGRVTLYSDMPISGQPPEGVDIASDRARADIVVSPFAGANAGASVRAAETTGKVVPAAETGKPAGVRAPAPAPPPRRRVGPCLGAGIGGRRGACAAAPETPEPCGVSTGIPDTAPVPKAPAGTSGAVENAHASGRPDGTDGCSPYGEAAAFSDKAAAAAGSPSETAAQTEPKEPAPAESVPPSKTEKNSGAPTSVSPDGRRKKH